jgi:uncharacterized protein (UPF0548 family)
MFLVRRPSAQRIERFLVESAALPLSYEPVGIARGGVAAGLCRDASTVVLGSGDETFEHAWAALQAWRQFAFGWVDVFASAPPTEVGTNLAVLIRHLGFWSLNGGRILYALEDDTRSRHRGYAYGTLTNHAERGEEIFRVSMDRSSAEVTYSILAVSRPHSALAWCGYPVARALQSRFRRDSCAAMQRASAEIR